MRDRLNFFHGVLQSVRALYPELSRVDLFVQVPEVKIVRITIDSLCMASRATIRSSS